MRWRRFSVVYGLLMCLTAPRRCWAEPRPEAVAGYERYVAAVEGRLARQRALHGPAGSYLALEAADLEAADLDASNSERRLRRGDVVVERLTPQGGSGLPGALLHHWRATAFAAGATAAGLEGVLRSFDLYPARFSPEVLGTKVLADHGDRMQAWMRVRQKHVLTVVMDGTYDVEFGRLRNGGGYSTSRSVRMHEVAGAGGAGERWLGAAEEHGFLWRLTTYWTYEERDGGLYLQVESVSLSRSIPAGLGWAVRPFVESVPRESLEFTLRAACAAVSGTGRQGEGH